MSAERYTTEKSTLNKKPEWGGALVGHHHHQHQHHQQHGHFLPQHQNLQQTQRPFAHHQLIGGRLDGMTFQPDAGVSRSEIAFKNPNANVDAHGVQQACHFNTVADSIMCCHDDDVGAAHTRPASALQERFGMPASDTSTHNKHKSSIGITGERHQASGVRDQVICAGKSDLSMSTSIKMPAPRRSRNTSMSPLTVRPTGTKDRHSKVRTAKGLRDRRVRLSAPTAIQFFDVQDRLGYDQPSKAVDWLIKKARAAIDELAPVEAVIAGGETIDVPARERKLSKDLHDGSLVKVKDEEQSMAVPTAGDVRAESRAKARERARERVKEKCVSSSAIPTSATTSGEAAITAASTMPVQSFVPSTSSNVHQLLPELFLLSGQLRQQFDDPHRVTDLSSMLSQPASSATLAPHLLPLSSHFFSAPPSSSESSFVYPGDVSSSFQFSVPPVYATNTPISPRGTLQSIFSINPANSSMQSHMSHVLPLNMTMGALQQAHVYGATLTSVREDGRDNNEVIRQRSAELGSPDLHQHSHIPMRIHGMELDSHVEETRISPSSMQTDFQ